MFRSSSQWSYLISLKMKDSSYIFVSNFTVKVSTLWFLHCYFPRSHVKKVAMLSHSGIHLKKIPFWRLESVNVMGKKKRCVDGDLLSSEKSITGETTTHRWFPWGGKEEEQKEDMTKKRKHKIWQNLRQNVGIAHSYINQKLTKGCYHEIEH